MAKIQIDPHTRGFLRACYDEGVPELHATSMLIKAAMHNVQGNLPVPMGIIAQLSLFEAGRHVAKLASAA